MADYAIIAGVVFLAALAAGGVLLAAINMFRPGRAQGHASVIEKLKKEHASLQTEKATLEADLRHASAKVEELSEEKRQQSKQLENTITERNQLRERAAQDIEAARHLDQRHKDLLDAKEQMRREFNEIAGQLMQRHGETFKAQNSQQILNLLTPFKDQIDKFEKQVAESNRASRDQHVALTENIKSLTKRSAEMSEETQNLTRALKGNVQMQGAWGEMVLETILQRSGLREGEEYTRQETHSADDGGRLRTDYIVHLPNGERIIIDAKVSLTAFEGYVGAETDEERSARLAGHAASVKGHIKKLAGKEYHATAGGKLDFVIMFMAIEPALGAALQHDEAIVLDAAENKVAIATPTTLTIALKTIAAIWRVERQNRNAEEIASRAGKLYDKFVGFLKDMGEIGNRLKQAENAYDGAMNKLSQGRGNLVRQIEDLKSMGADANKSIPPEFLSDAPDDALVLPDSEQDPYDEDEDDMTPQDHIARRLSAGG